MPMHNPPHPGEVLQELVIKGMNLSVTEVARRLGVSRGALSRVIHSHAAVSVDLARRLEAAGVSTAQTWLDMQTGYDLWQTRKTKPPKVESLAA